MASEIRVTNIKANDGTSSLTVANSTGAVSTGQNLAVGGTLTSTGALTASGGIANAGTISAGTIGSSVNVNTQDYFIATMSANQDIGHDTFATVHFNSDTSDPQSWFNTSNHRFTPQKAGKYLINLALFIYNASSVTATHIYWFGIAKNDDADDATGYVVKNVLDTRTNYFYQNGGSVTGIIDFNGSSDYVVAKSYANNGTNTSHTNRISTDFSQFSGYRIGS